MKLRRWSVAIETGAVHLLWWLRFWRRSAAEQWVARMSWHDGENPLTRYVVVKR